MGKLRWGFLFWFTAGLCQLQAAPGPSCSIPLHLRRGVPFVDVMVQGHGPYRFAVDTGTSAEAMASPRLAKDLGLALEGRTWLLGLTGTARSAVDQVRLDSLEVEGYSFHSVRAMVHEPVAGLGSYDGVLGFSLFRNRLLTLDFPRRCMGLRTGVLDAGDPDVLSFAMPRNVPVVALTIDGRSVPVQIDSGGGGINLPLNAASRVQFARKSEVQVKIETQVNTVYVRGGVLKGELGLGEHVFRQPFVEISETAPVGNLGAASLQDFVLTFDQANRLVRLQARSRIHGLRRGQLAPETDGSRPGILTAGN
jgi:predicted aspartyl protease